MMTRAFKGRTKALSRAYEKLLDAQQAASTAIYAAAHPRMDIPWGACFSDYADQATRDRYLSARREVVSFEVEMSAQRRGWIENGRFSWYS